jgi:hypothetical protein
VTAADTQYFVASDHGFVHACRGRSSIPAGRMENPLRYARRRSVRRLPLQTGIKQKRRVFSGAGQPSAGQLYLSLRFVARRRDVRSKRS